MKKTLSILVISMLALSACGQASAQTSPAKVTVTMNEWGVSLSQSTVPAGQVTFVLKNSGKLTHELVILKTDLAADKIPMRVEDPTKVQEPGSIGEIEEVTAGLTKEDTFDLTPGNYVLMCNEEAHYGAGMHVPFTVK